MVQQALAGSGGAVKCAPSVVPAYSDQHLSQLSNTDTPMSAVVEEFDIGDQRARGVLAGADVNIQMLDTKISALSGGQKARLAMLVLRLKNPIFTYLMSQQTISISKGKKRWRAS